MLNVRNAAVCIVVILWLVKLCTNLESDNQAIVELVENKLILEQHESSLSPLAFCSHNDASKCLTRNKTHLFNQTHERKNEWPGQFLTEVENENVTSKNNGFIDPMRFHLDTFLDDFVINQLKNNKDLKLSKKCYAQWSNLRTNLIKSKSANFFDRSKYWSQQGAYVAS